MALPPVIPLSVLYSAAEQASPLVSPDGTKLAYLAPVDGITNVWVRELAGGDPKPVTDDSNRPIRTFVWAEDSTHLLYLQDSLGDENWRVFSVDVTTGSVRDLTPFDGVMAKLVGSSPSTRTTARRTTPTGSTSPPASSRR